MKLMYFFLAFSLSAAQPMSAEPICLSDREEVSQERLMGAFKDHFLSARLADDFYLGEGGQYFKGFIFGNGDKTPHFDDPYRSIAYAAIRLKEGYFNEAISYLEVSQRNLDSEGYRNCEDWYELIWLTRSLRMMAIEELATIALPDSVHRLTLGREYLADKRRAVSPSIQDAYQRFVGLGFPGGE